jgi:hypothetical protein
MQLQIEAVDGHDTQLGVVDFGQLFEFDDQAIHPARGKISAPAFRVSQRGRCGMNGTVSRGRNQVWSMMKLR